MKEDRYKEIKKRMNRIKSEWRVFWYWIGGNTILRLVVIFGAFAVFVKFIALIYSFLTSL